VPRYLAQKDRVGCGCSLRAWSGLECRAGWSTTRSGDGSVRSSVTGSMQACTGHRDSTVRLKVLLRMCGRGQEGPKHVDSMELRWQSYSPGTTSGAIPTVAWAGVAGEGLGKLPVTEVELLRGLAGTEVQRGGGSAVVQGALRGGARWRWH
jgi:hypothetical protein